MKKIFGALVLVCAIAYAAFGFQSGVTFGADYDITDTSLNTYGEIEFGRADHNFSLTVGTDDLLDLSERFLWFDANYFVGYLQTSSDTLVAGLTVGTEVEFNPYGDWHTLVEFNHINMLLRGEVFDLFPELWPILSFYGQLDIMINDYTFGFGGSIGGFFKLPW